METETTPIPFNESVPAPLAPLTHVVISPANIAAEQRKQRALRLTLKERMQMRAQIAQLDLKLSQGRYEEHRRFFESLKADYERLQALSGELAVKTMDWLLEPDLLDRISENNRQLADVKARGAVVEIQYRKLKPRYDQRAQLAQKLHEHELAVERDKLQREIENAMKKEAAIYERLIIDRWTRLGFAHKWSEDGKSYMEKVKFSEVGITLDAIYYKIDASYKTAFNNWKTNLPEGVYVAKQLLHEDTLAELTIACQRQVSGVYNTHGAWVVVHRLDSVDGLMNYVKFQDVMARYPTQYHRLMPICVGVGINRKVQWVNLAHFHHWLISGYTSSGKSNMVNVGICTLISKHTPDELRLVLIDLKGGLEFDYYSELPHLHGKIVDSVDGVADQLAELEAIMEERFKKFKGVAKFIEQYHAKRPNDPMPRILCVFDEVASVTEHGDITKRIRASLAELTRKGRAVGIHVWLCTQRPDVGIVEGQVKNNLGVRLTGRMQTSSDSVTVLGTGRAAELAAVPGRMMLSLGPDPLPIQTPHITDDDLAECLRVARSYQPPAPLDVPETRKVIHQQWTVERIVELSIKHLGGNVTWKRIYEAADDLSQSQARELVEKVWTMDCIEFEGKSYHIERGRGGARYLREFQPESA